MTNHCQPATEAVEGSVRILCNGTTPPLVTTEFQFDMNALFHAAVSTQHQDSMSFPVIAWSSDDDETEGSDDQGSASSDMTLSSSDLSSDEEEKYVPGYNCKLATKRGPVKRHRRNSGAAHRMVRSKALYSELCIMASSLSPAQSSSTQRHSGGAHRMVRSKALYSELSQMSPSLSTSLRRPTQRRSVASQMA